MAAFAALILALGASDVPALPLGAEVVDRTQKALYAADRETLFEYAYTEREWREVTTRDDYVGVVAIAGTGDVLLLSHGVRVRPGGEVETIAALAEIRSVRFVRTSSTWFVCGWTGTPPWGDVRSAHSVPIGDGIVGVLVASLDEGATWEVLERWSGGAIDDVAVTEAGDLVVLRRGGGIRRGALRLTDETVAVELEELVDPDSFEVIRPGPDYGGRVLFPTETHGLVSGGMFYEGTEVFESRDGGATWKSTVAAFELEASQFGDDNTYRGSLRLDSGRLVAVTKSGLQVWAGETFENWGPRTRFHFDRVVRDARGDLLVELENEQVWAFDAEGEWNPVAILRSQTLESPWKDE